MLFVQLLTPTQGGDEQNDEGCGAALAAAIAIASEYVESVPGVPTAAQ
jgi:hypothetical protein